MIYCYLTDTALVPSDDYLHSMPSAGTEGSKIVVSHDIFTNRSKGSVCQMDERVLSIFNVDDPSTQDRISANMLMDPRITHSTNERIAGLFTGASGQVYKTETEYAVGRMALHYDSYWAKHDDIAGDQIADLEYTQTNISQLKKLFNVIETIALSHTYDSTNKKWVYKNTAELNTILQSNDSLYGNGSTGSSSGTAGYVADTLYVPGVSLDSDLTATVQNKNTLDTTGTIKTGIGLNNALESYNATIVFPDYFEFCFRFSALSSETMIRVYLNPKTLLAQYNKCLIAKVVCPANPEDLINIIYPSVLNTLSESSRYVANMLTKEVTKSIDASGNDTTHLDTTNYSGAADFTTRYKSSDTTYTSFTFTCWYKGRKPNAAEMRRTIKTLLEDANGGASVEHIFPDLYVSTTFIIIPLYDTRVTADTNTNITYCTNIIKNIRTLLNYNGKDSATSISGVPTDIVNKADMLNVAGYYMYALVFPENYTDSSAICLDTLDAFKSYQPIGTTDSYWNTMSDDARDLNQKLTKLVAGQLYGYTPSDVEFITESKAIHGETYGNRNYQTFISGGYNFSMMTRESYMNSISN